MRSTKNSVVMGCSLSPETFDLLNKAAHRVGMSRSACLDRILREYFEMPRVPIHAAGHRRSIRNQQPNDQ